MAATAPSAIFEMSDAQVAAVHRVLGARQAKQAIFQTVKRTTNKGGQIAARVVAERLPIPKKYIIGDNRYAAIKVKINTTGDAPVGTISIKQKNLPLTAYRYRQLKRGVRVNVDRSEPVISLRHGFVADVKSKAQDNLGVFHRGIFTRAKVDSGKEAEYFFRNKSSFHRAASRSQITPRGYAWRLPLEEHYGPSVLDFISRREIFARITSEIGDFRERTLDSQISRFTKGKYLTLSEAVAALDIATTDAADNGDATPDA